MITSQQAVEQVDRIELRLSAVKPKALEVLPANIPARLRDVQNWVCWRYVQKNGRWTKLPRKADGPAASPTDPSTWTAFDQALTAYRHGGHDGIGFVLDGKAVTTDGLVVAGVDLDHVTDSQASRDRANRLLGEFGSYAEWSPSGCGVRIFCLAKPLRTGLNRGGVELYTSGRYLTVTGHRLEVGDV